MRRALTALGFILMLAGGLWALQGAGLVTWPAESFMLREHRWVLYGVATAAAGLLVLVFANRRRR